MTETTIVVIALVLLFLFYEQTQQPPNALGVPPPPGGAGGSPHDANALAHGIGAAAGVGACAVGGALAGAPQAGLQLAPICGVLGSLVAPAVAKGAVYAAQETAKGATFVAKKVAQGAVLGTHAAGVVLSDPFAPTLGVTGVTLGVAGKTTAVLDRGTTAIYNRLPVPAQLAVAPIVLGERVTAKTVAVAARAGGAVVGTLSSGAKSATSAVSSGVHKVLGWL